MLGDLNGWNNCDCYLMKLSYLAIFTKVSNSFSSVASDGKPSNMGICPVMHLSQTYITAYINLEVYHMHV
jgi:hypothetical protein